jgi:hypothetical protein
MQDTLEIFVTPLANPYLFIPALPVACNDTCTFCTRGYKKLFPKLAKSGVTSTFLDLFAGPNAMQALAV